MTCSVQGCPRPVLALGYCSGHYQRVKVHGDPRADVPFRSVKRVPVAANAPAGCAVTGCDRERVTHGYCEPHYRRVRKFGDPRADIPIGDLQRKPPVTCTCTICGAEFVKGKNANDGDIRNNHPDNLEVMTQSEHIRLHEPWRWREVPGATARQEAA